MQAYIPVKYSEWKQVNPKKSIKDYVALVKNERKHAEAVAEDDGTKRYKTNLESEAQEFDTAYANNNQKPKKPVIRALDRLVDRINLVLDEAHAKGYIIDFAKAQLRDQNLLLPVTDWDVGTHTGVIGTFSDLVAKSTGTIAVSGHGNPAVPVVPYSRAKLYLPWSASTLIKKIYQGWLAGTPLDMRTVNERGDRQNLALPNPSLAVARPGTMRSWHQDAHGLLPAIPVVDQAPANVQNFAAYAVRHSGSPNNMGDDAVPSGYIEYTGTGHGNDYANFRLLLDYKQGLIYMCFHYQLWSNGDAPEIHGQNPAQHQDKNNPWINIKMNA